MADPAISREPTLDDHIADEEKPSRQAADSKDDLEKLVAEKTGKKTTQPSRPVVQKSVVQKPIVQKQIAQKPAPAKTVKYVVKKGDTLSGIAARHKISMASLRDHNKLPDQQVRIGQTLQIPAAAR
jgi:LysM repeat protein